jgi:hypothetical protein
MALKAQGILLLEHYGKLNEWSTCTLYVNGSF